MMGEVVNYPVDQGGGKTTMGESLESVEISGDFQIGHQERPLNGFSSEHMKTS